MAFELPKLPYQKNALEPHISQETLEYHYGKHHQAYVDKLNSLIPGTAFAKASLEEIILNAEGAIFNNAAQVWNHTFYWHSMSPQGGGLPTGKLSSQIEKDFGSFEAFKTQFTEAGLTQFGSGWAWLAKDHSGHLIIEKTPNAANPMQEGLTPILTCDVWEHAYYIDTRNDRAQYLNHFWQVVNWEFAESNL